MHNETVYRQLGKTHFLYPPLISADIYFVSTVNLVSMSRLMSVFRPRLGYFICTQLVVRFLLQQVDDPPL